ncbi:iron dicitrate transport regulator FecR [Roseateles sp. DAIF2]|uniref:FecR family protein n=1 Tax=Roseateles sp. DAIF2 TaxID=2714952 RepID=UPI0018A2C77D|nr:FecR domain-containing protein [Roseateles sp. DAIF2]QPF72370.1 iron dicitrate transport regulator FecR [Roseateles sp. DAIF2]
MKDQPLSAINARAAEWIVERDRHDGRLPAERQLLLDDWLRASTLHRVAFLRLEQIWQRADRLRALHVAPPAQDIIRTRTPALKVRMPRFTWWPASRLVAGLSLALMALVMVADFHGDTHAQRHATARGQRESVRLADGSQLTLNTATTLRTAVSEAAREVWLDRGEAFFDIAHDAKRPFVVHAGRQTVTVLGTKFSLHREGDRLRVAVLEGRVQVQPARSRPAVLNRDDTALADASNVLVARQAPQQVSASLGWLRGKLEFDQVTLAEAAAQFNRYGRKQLVIQDEAAARINIGGIFDADNVEAFARVLNLGFGLEVQTEGDTIRVSSPARRGKPGRTEP